MQYRLLENGEQFKEGDETLDDNCETWSKLDHHFFRAHFNPYVNVPVRRAIIQQQLQPDNSCEHSFSPVYQCVHCGKIGDSIA